MRRFIQVQERFLFCHCGEKKWNQHLNFKSSIQHWESSYANLLVKKAISEDIVLLKLEASQKMTAICDHGQNNKRNVWQQVGVTGVSNESATTQI